MKNLIFIALLSCFAVPASEMGSATNQVVLASGAGANKVSLDHLIESTRKHIMNAFPSTRLADYKETTVVFQDKPVVQMIYFKSATENGFLFEYRIENGKAKLVKEMNEPLQNP